MPTILIAEDEPDIRDLVAFTLQFGGFQVVVTSNGQEAVERAVETRPDLILLDVRMPRMTGYEACAALKKNPDTAAIPVVFLSAKGQEAEVKSGLAAGALEYILKPFAPDELISRVGELLKAAAQPASPEALTLPPGRRDGGPAKTRRARAKKAAPAKPAAPQSTAKAAPEPVRPAAGKAGPPKTDAASA